MAYRKVPQISDHARAAVLMDLKVQQLALKRAQRAFNVSLRDALDLGFTTRQLAQELGTAAANVSRWARDAAA